MLEENIQHLPLILTECFGEKLLSNSNLTFNLHEGLKGYYTVCYEFDCIEMLSRKELVKTTKHL